MYDYVCIPFQQVLNLTIRNLHVDPQPGAYRTHSLADDQLDKLLAAGYRWVRTDENMAVLERWVPEADPDDINAEFERAEIKDSQDIYLNTASMLRDDWLAEWNAEIMSRMATETDRQIMEGNNEKEAPF